MNFRRTRSKEIQNQNEEETRLNQSSEDDSDENDKNDENNNPIENVIENSKSQILPNTNVDISDISDINKQPERQRQKQNVTDNNQSPTTEQRERKQKEKEQEKESQTPRQHNEQKDKTPNNEYETIKKDGLSEIEMSNQIINDNESKYKKNETKNSNNSNSSDSDGKFASSRKLGKYPSLAHMQRGRSQGVCSRLCISSIDPRLEELAQDIIKDKDGSLNINNPNDNKNIEIAVQRTLAAHDNRRLSTILTQTENEEQFKMYKQIHCSSWYSWLIEISLFVNIMKIFWEPASLSESVKISCLVIEILCVAVYGYHVWCKSRSIVTPDSDESREHRSHQPKKDGYWWRCVWCKYKCSRQYEQRLNAIKQKIADIEGCFSEKYRIQQIMVKVASFLVILNLIVVLLVLIFHCINEASSNNDNNENSNNNNAEYNNYIINDTFVANITNSTCSFGNNNGTSENSIVDPYGHPASIGSLYILTRFFRLFYAFYYSKALRLHLKAIPYSVYQLKELVVVVVLTWLIFAMIGYGLLYELKYIDDGQNDYFDSFSKSLWSLLVMQTTSNFPDVILANYNETRYVGIYFLVYVVVTIFLLMSLVFALLYSYYSNNISEKNAETIANNKKENLMRAFYCLSQEALKTNGDFNGTIKRKTFEKFVHKLGKQLSIFKINKKDTNRLFDYLTEDNEANDNNKMYLDQFLQFSEEIRYVHTYTNSYQRVLTHLIKEKFVEIPNDGDFGFTPTTPDGNVLENDQEYYAGQQAITMRRGGLTSRSNISSVSSSNSSIDKNQVRGCVTLNVKPLKNEQCCCCKCSQCTWVMKCRVYLLFMFLSKWTDMIISIVITSTVFIVAGDLFYWDSRLVLFQFATSFAIGFYVAEMILRMFALDGCSMCNNEICCTNYFGCHAKRDNDDDYHDYDNYDDDDNNDNGDDSGIDIKCKDSVDVDDKIKDTEEANSPLYIGSGDMFELDPNHRSDNVNDVNVEIEARSPINRKNLRNQKSKQTDCSDGDGDGDSDDRCNNCRNKCGVIKKDTERYCRCHNYANLFNSFVTISIAVVGISMMVATETDLSDENHDWRKYLRTGRFITIFLILRAFTINFLKHFMAFVSIVVAKFFHMFALQFFVVYFFVLIGCLCFSGAVSELSSCQKCYRDGEYINETNSEQEFWCGIYDGLYFNFNFNTTAAGFGTLMALMLVSSWHMYTEMFWRATDENSWVYLYFVGAYYVVVVVVLNLVVAFFVDIFDKSFDTFNKRVKFNNKVRASEFGHGRTRLSSVHANGNYNSRKGTMRNSYSSR